MQLADGKLIIAGCTFMETSDIEPASLDAGYFRHVLRTDLAWILVAQEPGIQMPPILSQNISCIRYFKKFQLLVVHNSRFQVSGCCEI